MNFFALEAAFDGGDLEIQSSSALPTTTPSAKVLI